MQGVDAEVRVEKSYEHPSFARHVVNDSIKNFTPSWFAVNMGTGAVSVLLHSFPYGSRTVLYGFGASFLVLNIVLFILFFVVSIIRYVRYPEVFRLMYEHPLQSLYLGCMPMGFATIINAALDVYKGYGLGGKTFLYCLWGLWWFDAAVSLSIYFLMLYTMITRHNHSIQALTAVWLLPTITAIVPSTTGALLAESLLQYSTYHAIVSLFMAGLLLSLGLGLTFMILPLYTLRLITEGLPPHSLITSKFIPVGPCGQAGTAFIVIGRVLAQLAERAFSKNILLREAQPLILLGVCAGLFLWMFGVWWTLLSLISIYETFKSNRPKFAAGFWGMVFPLGVYSILTLQLADILGSTFFRVTGAILSIVVFLLWTSLAGMTIYDLYSNRERLLNAPVLSNNDASSEPVEDYRQQRQLSSVETAC